MKKEEANEIKNKNLKEKIKAKNIALSKIRSPPHKHTIFKSATAIFI